MHAGWYGWSVKAAREEAGRRGAAPAENPAALDPTKLDIEELRRLAEEDPAAVADVLRLWLQEEGSGR